LKYQFLLGRRLFRFAVFPTTNQDFSRQWNEDCPMVAEREGKGQLVVGANPVVVDHLDASTHPIVATIHLLLVKYY